MTITADEYEYWLADMDDALDRFFSTLPPDVRSRLDYSMSSLDALEAWTLSRYAKVNQLQAPAESRTLDGLARYVGETFRKQLGGHWQIRLDDPKYAYYGLPQITGYAARPTPESPHSLVTASVDRRRGNYWSTILANTIKRKG